MVAGVEPAVVGMAEAVEFADVDHLVLPLIGVLEPEMAGS
jgi:hypothetical protein